ncbi:MAG: hypothetical protein ACKPCI_32665, partial [Dolichospermum sp.]
MKSQVYRFKVDELPAQKSDRYFVRGRLVRQQLNYFLIEMKLIASKGDHRKSESPKSKVISSKLTEEELQDLDLIATRNGVSRAHWIRLAIINSIKQNSQAAAKQHLGVSQNQNPLRQQWVKAI